MGDLTHLMKGHGPGPGVNAKPAKTVRFTLPAIAGYALIVLAAGLWALGLILAETGSRSEGKVLVLTGMACFLIGVILSSWDVSSRGTKDTIYGFALVGLVLAAYAASYLVLVEILGLAVVWAAAASFLSTMPVLVAVVLLWKVTTAKIRR